MRAKNVRVAVDIALRDGVRFAADLPLRPVLVAAVILLRSVTCEDPHEGLYIGKINTYAHQVSGHVYAIDEYTILIKNFFYDGLGQDAFFWAGSSVRPSNVGFIVPDEEGKTNKLQPYTDKDIYLQLPNKRKITSIRWFAVWNLRENANYGDIFFPEGFEPPSPRRISEFSRRGAGVRSGTVVIVDSKTIEIPDFYFSGNVSDTYFWVGLGPQPNSAGQKIPDEKGYLEPLGRYEEKTIQLTLPGKMTVFDIDWLSVWNAESNENYGSVIVPHGQDIPPSKLGSMKHESRLPNCEQLHATLQLRWEIQGRSITLQLTGQIEEDEYIAFGISGATNSSKMVGADVAVCYIDGHYANAVDYNISDRFPCSNVLGRYRGVCPDLKVEGKESYQILTFTRKDGLTSFVYRRTLLNPDDDGDQIFNPDGNTYLVWAIGKYNEQKEPSFHHTFPRGDLKINFGRKDAADNCFEFTTGQNRKKPDPWPLFRIRDKAVDTFVARIGPAGLWKGYVGITGRSSPGESWYMNGVLVPEIHVQRGHSYTFRVEGGNNPHNARYYHPLYITDSPSGGYARLTETEEQGVKIYAGIQFDRRGRPQPSAAGRLCAWLYNTSEPRQADEYASFPKFRNTLRLQCDDGQPAVLSWMPNDSTPDVVYYQSYTTPNVGWKIVVQDEIVTGSAAVSWNRMSPCGAVTLLIALALSVRKCV
ncbi:LOW QUALITY PROTEIN: protein Skeletor, isoforms B/C-like [Rhipicephalus sanguineus]|uniref:LOW QUALITY PROTEIN: protein Skeletor, isoforms B/C-like n=1 Tax=Rhipicephalus sanguineus TaxID=34632 RepID=UPI0018940988|nr:LOW QUALITY PROTEIN: protein Skeletor, isoforms B/C-like [Rhipicephalus sanguineus]